ncbi:cytochrome P450 [Coprinopsis marcescibilis]|uniref:Cytochrome P450 n=1 Tax=Coprinopsis marcescibilis TaxID=230819 RepID=A0A5C3KGA3_COPMA|nr:cytochrome P450 [Coprinopsis marcescibilis]
MGYEAAIAIAIAGASAFVVIRKLQWNARSKGLPLPPSPKGLPIIGNAFDIPTKFEWEVYEKWGQELGSDVIYANALGFSLVVLNRRKAAVHILETKSAATSSRPFSPMVCELLGWDNIIPLAPNGDEYKNKRKLFQQHFHPNNMSLHRAGLRQSLPQLLTSVLDNPGDFRHANKMFMVGTIVKLTYGVHKKDRVEYYAKLFDDALEPPMRAAIPGSYLVDIFPWLKYVPEWFPGAGFKKEARKGKELGRRFADEPLEEALKLMHSGSGEPYFVATAHADADSAGGIDPNRLRFIRDVGASVYSAGVETTLGTLDYFYYAMSVYPEVQQRAQKELDEYLKGEGLADFHDEPHLPYITAIVRELIRWQPVVPLGVAHQSTEDLVYDGLFIPKDSIIMANQWAMSLDEEEYPEPHVFKPERYLTPEGQLDPSAPNPESIAFGFGRRFCPGSHIALSTMFITVSALLELFTFTKVEEFDPERQVKIGNTRGPTDFRCGITPRVRNARDLIQSMS